jgi:hypothetical protein
VKKPTANDLGPSSVHGRGMPHTRQNSQTSTCDNSTIMALIDDAVAAFELQDPEDLLMLKAYTDCFGVDCSTLGQRLQGVTRPKQEVSKQQQNLNPQQEYEPVCYMKGLTKEGLPPTRAIIQNFGSEVAKKRLLERWVPRFLDQNAFQLI